MLANFFQLKNQIQLIFVHRLFKQLVCKEFECVKEQKLMKRVNVEHSCGSSITIQRAAIKIRGILMGKEIKSNNFAYYALI
jgi:hypothetical protein